MTLFDGFFGIVVSNECKVLIERSVTIILVVVETFSTKWMWKWCDLIKTRSWSWSCRSFLSNYIVLKFKTLQREWIKYPLRDKWDFRFYLKLHTNSPTIFTNDNSTFILHFQHILPSLQERFFLTSIVSQFFVYIFFLLHLILSPSTSIFKSFNKLILDKNSFNRSQIENWKK